MTIILFFVEQEAGLPVTEKCVLSEYQVLREIIFTFLCPTHCQAKMPLFEYVGGSGFRPCRDVCVPSLMPKSLQSYLGDICQALTAKRDLDNFVDFALDQVTNTF